MHSVRLEPTKLILRGTRTTYQATGDYIMGQSGMPVQQYDGTVGTGRPTPQQPPIGCGLPGPYGSRPCIRETMSADICISQNVSPRL